MQANGAPSEAERALLTPLMAHLPPSVLKEAYVPPVTDGSGKNRRSLRRAARLLDRAGWPVIDGLRQNMEGEPLRIEFLTNSSAFERITGPYVEVLRRLGVDASLRRVDPAQYQQRVEDFDFDIITARFVTSPTPGPSLRGLFSSQSAEARGSLNMAGVMNDGVDALVEAVIAAPDRAALGTAVSALDRALRSLHIWSPHWHKGSHTIAYWDKFGRPERKPPYDRAVIDTWWVDPVKQAALAAATGR